MSAQLTEHEVLSRVTFELWAFVAGGRPVFDEKSKGPGQGVIRMGARGGAFLHKRKRPPQAVEIRPFERLLVRARKGDRWVTYCVLRPAT
ncbi:MULTISPECIES: hypothetical protein [unclassified Brevundimonas]|uniref:hypothetical protein n=1 Tax=unclassified Brevundimonas TaxID=2622653 RepID=UPI000CFAE0F3|nr:MULTISPECIES: hypothetical protein [unclassified Brevundimonas]PRA36661.1 hypothetical protein CQ024_00700 [Brevundimonas sp. MYb27]PQZ79478.1 hypothetical protein CQ026_11910 [Brevundimonas sp. MYb31]PRB13000.1 hypothetical protein CQ039_13715 [Brevundimonas sp. MYb52]PRB33642.1 hypothetical protein CQ035_12805 [Brevundimonas sp. MYb46]PRB48910.1 hypothetical protein CQ028_08995 [Brevundimonas sp. MYb33]